MKKYLFLLLGALPITLLAQTKADKLTLKNGDVVTGSIYKMDNGKIYLARVKDSVVYTADELQTIAFCNTNNKPCTDASSNATTTSATTNGMQKSVSTNASTFSSFEDKEDQVIGAEKDDNEKGVVTFKCNMCGNSGTLTINGENGSNKSKAKYTFTMEKDKHFFVYAAKLLPGEYNWNYSDNSNNATKGKLQINKGDEKKIVLFEKE